LNCRSNQSFLKIYTDGSGLDGHIGAAAVLTRGFHPFRIARYYLGPDTEHTVYEGECVGQLLGLYLVNQLRPNQNINSISIAVDNQASILAHRARKCGPGSNIIDHIYQTLLTTKRAHANARTQIRWIPGHRDIPGSERADEEAKKACEETHRNRNGNTRFLRQGIPASKSAIKQPFKKKKKKSVFSSPLI
jgi:ribonuclease HI